VHNKNIHIVSKDLDKQLIFNEDILLTKAARIATVIFGKSGTTLFPQLGTSNISLKPERATNM